MVVDPVKKEDGVFYWQGNDISKRAAFRLYDSDNPSFCIQKYTTNNAHIEVCNPHLSLDNNRKTIEAITLKNNEKKFVTEKKAEFQTLFSEPENNENKTLKLGAFGQNKMEKAKEKRTVLRIKALSFLPKICGTFAVSRTISTGAMSCSNCTVLV